MYKCLYWLAAAGLTLSPALAQFRDRNFNINVRGDGESCADLRVTSNAEIARATQTFSLSRGEAPTLDMSATSGSAIKVRGWDQANYSVEACKIAVAEDRGTAERLLNGIAVTHSGGRMSVSGSGDGAGEWQVYFFVHAPRDANLNLEARNGPLEVSGMAGSLTVRATNGPVSISNCTGTVQAHTNNGPISFTGQGGEAHLGAENGPISVKLTADVWRGSQLEARTVNGPLSVEVPESFQSSMRVEASSRSPISCKLDACSRAIADFRNDTRVIQFNGASEVVKLSTENGPVSIQGLKRGIM